MLLAILILQSTYTTSATNLNMSLYWQTTSVTDKVVDYWNHGPIFIPGLEDVYTITTKPPDIFPPWLTKLTTSTRRTTIKLSDKKTRPTIHKEFTKESPKNSKPNKQTKSIPRNRIVNTTQSQKQTKPQPSLERIEIQDPTDPFSVFLRKFLRVLSVKSHLELPALFKPFTSYMTELIKDGDLNGLGDTVVEYVKNMNEKLKELIFTPDILHTQCYQASNMLSNRQTALDPDTNALLDFLDDMYDEAEEEVMQIVLHEATKFPNTNTTAEEIAYSFVNNVFLTPMNRINGTSRRDTLVNMLTTAVIKRLGPWRRHYGNMYRKKRSRNDLSSKKKHKKKQRKNKTKNKKKDKKKDKRKNKKTVKKKDTDMNIFTENNVKGIRDNMKNIDNLINTFRIDMSASDTSAYKFELSEDVDETDDVKQVENETKKTRNNETQPLRTNGNYDEESSLENDEYNKTMVYGQMYDVTPNIKSIIDNLESFIDVSDNETQIGLFHSSSVFPKKSLSNFRFRNIKKHQNNEYTVLFPSYLLTKLVKTRVPYDPVTKSHTKKHKTSLTTIYFNDDKGRITTKPSNKLVHKVPKSQTKKERGNELKIKTKFDKVPFIGEIYDHTVNHQHKNKPIARIHLERRPDYLDDQLETMKSSKTITLKPFSNKITKHTPKTGITNKKVKSLRNGKTKTLRVPNTLKNITKLNMYDKLYMYIKEENTEESDDSDTYTEHSSESLGHKSSNHTKTKYERLKRKYNILKRLSEQILAQNEVKNMKTTPEVIQKMRGKDDEAIENNTKATEDVDNQIDSETKTKVHNKIKINDINLFLNDYDGKIEFEEDSQETKKVDYRDIIRKSFPLNTTTDNSARLTATEYSDAEKELKQNINDAIRHMDFVNYNSSRRNDDVKPKEGADSEETDVEAVLKTNIYKAVKKLLKT